MRADSLDPELAAVIDEIDAAGVPEWHAMSVSSARRVEDEVFSGGKAPDVGLVRDLAVEGPHGEIPIRVYHPDADLPARTLVFFHGGGWTLGTLDSIDGVCREIAVRADAVVVSVDYRLAPEHRFPVAVDDAVAAVRWVAENAGSIGGHPDRLGVAGTSAGGNLAAVTALYAREFDGPGLAGQFLLYPITGPVRDTDSYRENAGGPLLTRRDMEWFFEQYLRSPVDAYSPFVSPLRADELGDLPPATVVTAGFDPIRDDGVAYADRFDDAGVPVKHRHYPTMAHGFLSLTDRVTVADEAMTALAGDVRDRL